MYFTTFEKWRKKPFFFWVCVDKRQAQTYRNAFNENSNNFTNFTLHHDRSDKTQEKYTKTRSLYTNSYKCLQMLTHYYVRSHEKREKTRNIESNNKYTETDTHTTHMPPPRIFDPEKSFGKFFRLKLW